MCNEVINQSVMSTQIWRGSHLSNQRFVLWANRGWKLEIVCPIWGPHTPTVGCSLRYIFLGWNKCEGTMRQKCLEWNGSKLIHRFIFQEVNTVNTCSFSSFNMVNITRHRQPGAVGIQFLYKSLYNSNSGICTKVWCESEPFSCFMIWEQHTPCTALSSRSSYWLLNWWMWCCNRLFSLQHQPLLFTTFCLFLVLMTPSWNKLLQNDNPPTLQILTN